MPDQNSKSDRKYQSEFSLLIVAQGAYFLRAQDLQHIPIEAIDTEPPCHLYVISRSPRIAIPPDTVVIDEENISGVVTVSNRGKLDSFQFSLRHHFAPDRVKWESDWPYEEFQILNSFGERIQGGVCALLGHFASEWPAEAKRNEVLYVGQAFGKTGDRTAWDRLRRHETLQRILADQTPDRQVWLTMARISDVQMLTEFSPHAGAVPDAEDTEHIEAVMKRVSDGSFYERESVALAEAGLIRGWQPKYNDKLKYRFPARKQVSLETVRSLDLYGLVVEWQSDELPSRYWAETLGPDDLFFFGFEVHQEPGRSVTLSMATLETRPGVRNTRFVSGPYSEPGEVRE